jgi:hypothetical protein
MVVAKKVITKFHLYITQFVNDQNVYKFGVAEDITSFKLQKGSLLQFARYVEADHIGIEEAVIKRLNARYKQREDLGSNCFESESFEGFLNIINLVLKENSDLQATRNGYAQQIMKLMQSSQLVPSNTTEQLLGAMHTCYESFFPDTKDRELFLRFLAFSQIPNTKEKYTLILCEKGNSYCAILKLKRLISSLLNSEYCKTFTLTCHVKRTNLIDFMHHGENHILIFCKSNEVTQLFDLSEINLDRSYILSLDSTKVNADSFCQFYYPIRAHSTSLHLLMLHDVIRDYSPRWFDEPSHYGKKYRNTIAEWGRTVCTETERVIDKYIRESPNSMIADGKLACFLQEWNSDLSKVCHYNLLKISTELLQDRGIELHKGNFMDVCIQDPVTKLKIIGD